MKLRSGILIDTTLCTGCERCVKACKEENNPLPPEEQPQLNLTLEDVSCTEAWIKLNVTNLTFPADVELYRDSSLAETINLASADTVLYLDSLLPNKAYIFTTRITSISEPVTSNQKLLFKTLINKLLKQ